MQLTKNGATMGLQPIILGFNSTIPHTLRAEVNPTGPTSVRVKVFVDGAQVISQPDASPPSGSLVGLGTKAQATNFDGFVLSH